MAHNTREIRERAMGGLALAFGILANDPSILFPAGEGACALQRNGYGIWYFHVTFTLDNGLKFAGGCHVRDAHGRLTPIRATICFPGHDKLTTLPEWLSRDQASKVHEFEFHLRGDGLSCTHITPKAAT